MKATIVAVPDPLPIAYPNGYCWCGCGEQLAKSTKFFVSNHDRGAEARVIREVYGSIPNFLLAHGYGPPDSPPVRRMVERMRARNRSQRAESG